MSAFEKGWGVVKMPIKRYSSKERRLFDRNEIPYEEKIEWVRNKYGAKPRTYLLAEDTLAEPIIQQISLKRQQSKEQRELKTKKKKEKLEELAESLGLLPNSRTFQRYLTGEIEEEDARKIGTFMNNRHDNTNYDELLEQGYSKDDARSLMERD